jgi:hypothetical protein
MQDDSGHDGEDISITLPLKIMRDLYAARRYLSLETQKAVGLRWHVDVYFKDPLVAQTNAAAAIDPNFTTVWEPGLRDGPTSANFAVVDFDATTNTLTPPAKWSESKRQFVTADDKVLDQALRHELQFHQVSVWATVQNTLDFFEGPFALGRRISWGFDGNRLILVPHAGNGENAYYDRDSKSLQFYWFDKGEHRIFTCLSSDIVNHEFGHAVLDGLRPHFYESIRIETAAFHEYVGDMTAMLMAFRNNDFRKFVLLSTGGDLAKGNLLADLAPEFGEAVTGQHSLRSGLSKRTMTDSVLEPHAMSEVMTGALYDILRGVFDKLTAEAAATRSANPAAKGRSPGQILYSTCEIMQTLAVQPLDFLPPSSVTFRDYAIAMLRADEAANPLDKHGFRPMIQQIFVDRGIFASLAEAETYVGGARLRDRMDLDVYHPPENIAASRGGAYRFLDDNRRKLMIPANADLVIPDVIRAHKLARDTRTLPDQIILQYLWREDVLLQGAQFGRFAGQRTTMHCGGTLVLDQNGNALHWARKPGTVLVEAGQDAREEQEKGRKRLAELLETLADRIKVGMIGEEISGPLGLVQRVAAPFSVSEVDGALRFRLSPHFSLRDTAANPDSGEGQWTLSF